MRTGSKKMMVAYAFILPAIYTMFMLLVYKVTGDQSVLTATPLKSLVPTLLVLLVLPTVAFMLNTEYRSYQRLRGQRLLSSLILLVWVFNVILFIGACAK